jgi:hypothetical protein
MELGIMYREEDGIIIIWPEIPSKEEEVTLKKDGIILIGKIKLSKQSVLAMEIINTLRKADFDDEVFCSLMGDVANAVHKLNK